MQKRIVSAVLAFLLLLGTLVSCSAGTSGEQDAENTDPVTESAEETTADPTALPEMNLDGWTFTAFVRGTAENSYWKCVDIYMEDYTGDVLNDAVIDRNNIIEEKYNCTIAQLESTNQSLTEARNLISSGDSTFAAMCLRSDYSAALAADRSLTDLMTLPYLQLDQPWWDQNAVQELSIGGKVFFTTGDLSISCNDAVQIPVFNKTVLAQFEDMDDPYQLVRDGVWTVDKMTEMALSVNADANGDGLMNEADTWGYLAYVWGGLFLFFGTGESVVTKDENDLPVLSLYNDRSVEVIDLIYKVHGGGNPDIINGYSALQTTLMSEDRVLFTITSMATVRKQFRNNVDSDIGILPVPKYNEEQDRYYNLVVFQGTANMYSVPKTCSDLQKTGFVLEALAQESTDTLREAYYDKTISYKALRDQDSLEMLEIILATLTYDLASAYDWGGWISFFTSTIPNSGGNNQFASYYRSKEAQTIAAISDTVLKLTEEPEQTQ